MHSPAIVLRKCVTERVTQLAGLTLNWYNQ